MSRVDVLDVADLDFFPTLAFPTNLSSCLLLCLARLRCYMTTKFILISPNTNSPYSVCHMTRSSTIYYNKPTTVSCMYLVDNVIIAPPHHSIQSPLLASSPLSWYNRKTNRVINRFRPTLAIWGITAGLGVSLYLSEVPLFQKDVLRKIPFVSLISFGGTTLNEVPLSVMAALPVLCLSISSLSIATARDSLHPQPLALIFSSAFVDSPNSELRPSSRSILIIPNSKLSGQELLCR